MTDKKARESRALSCLLPESTPQPEGVDEPGTSQMVIESGNPKEGRSEYELMRQANIARNQRLLAELGLGKEKASEYVIRFFSSVVIL